MKCFYIRRIIIAIQEKLGINGRANQTAMHQSKKVKTLADSYELLLDILPIRDDLSIDGNPILEEALRSNKASTDISLAEIYNLLLYLEEDIMAIQEELGIVGYTNQKKLIKMQEYISENLRNFTVP